MRPLLAERMRRRQATSEATKTVRKNNQETKSAFNQSNSQAYDPTDKQTNIRQHQKRCSTCKRFSVSSVVTFTPIQQQLDHHVSKYSLENHHVALAKRAFVASNWGLPKMFSLWAVLSTILLIWNLKFFRFISFGLLCVYDLICILQYNCDIYDLLYITLFIFPLYVSANSHSFFFLRWKCTFSLSPAPCSNIFVFCWFFLSCLHILCGSNSMSGKSYIGKPEIF